jgi:hypothetical protein
MTRWFKDNSVPLEQAEGIAPEERGNKIVVGEYVSRQIPTLTENVYKVLKEAQKIA